MYSATPDTVTHAHAYIGGDTLGKRPSWQSTDGTCQFKRGTTYSGSQSVYRMVVAWLKTHAKGMTS